MNDLLQKIDIKKTATAFAIFILLLMIIATLHQPEETYPEPEASKDQGSEPEAVYTIKGVNSISPYEHRVTEEETIRIRNIRNSTVEIDFDRKDGTHTLEPGGSRQFSFTQIDYMTVEGANGNTTAKINVDQK
jgi:hypothetical protein